MTTASDSLSERDAPGSVAAGALVAGAGPEAPIPELRAVFEEHVDHVGNSLRRLGVRDADIPDVIQDVFVVLHHLLPDYDTERPMWPWIFAIVYRTAGAYRRKAFREIPDEGASAADLADSSENLDEKMRQAENRELVLAALQHVEIHRRAVFVMADLDDIPVPEIARALGIALNTAYSRLRLAREDFRDAAARLLRKRGDR